MAIKINDYSYTPRKHFEPITVSGSYHNIISVSWTKEISRRHSNIITMATYKNEDSYIAGDRPFQQTGYNINIDTTGSLGQNVSILSASYEALKSQAPLYSGSKHVVDVL
tara:strand:+ start:198 stop:527 length:330 start_codon:yes stop_codon:yes gene_type:complete